MKYIEELISGDCFLLNEEYFILTSDFKSDGQRYSVSLKTGLNRWLKSDNMVEQIDIFTLDKHNNILAIKERQKNDIP